MQVIIDEIVTEVVVEGPSVDPKPAIDPDTLRDLVLAILREELERQERHEDGPTWR